MFHVRENKGNKRQYISKANIMFRYSTIVNASCMTHIFLRHFEDFD